MRVTGPPPPTERPTEMRADLFGGGVAACAAVGIVFVVTITDDVW